MPLYFLLEYILFINDNKSFKLNKLYKLDRHFGHLIENASLEESLKPIQWSKLLCTRWRQMCYYP